jgi:hypothetical protein
VQFLIRAKAFYKISAACQTGIPLVPRQECCKEARFQVSAEAAFRISRRVQWRGSLSCAAHHEIAEPASQQASQAEPRYMDDSHPSAHYYFLFGSDDTYARRSPSIFNNDLGSARAKERESTMEPRPGSECVYVGEQRAGGALWY